MRDTEEREREEAGGLKERQRGERKERKRQR